MGTATAEPQRQADLEAMAEEFFAALEREEAATEDAFHKAVFEGSV